MTRRITHLTIVAGSALALVPAAFGQTQLDAFERAVGARADASGVLRDAFERAAAAGSTGSPAVYRDAFERMVVARQGSAASRPDAHDRIVGVATPSVQLPLRFPPDAFERGLQNRSVWIAALGDHNTRMEASAQPVQPLAPQPSTREVAWVEIAVGFMLGAVLALGLALGLRMTRVRQLAH